MSVLPIADTGAVQAFETFRSLVDEMYESAQANGKLDDLANFVENAYGISPSDPEPKLRLAQALQRTAEMYEAGGVVEALAARV